MQKCNNCGEEIKEFTISHAALGVTSGQKIKIVRLECPYCSHIQHVFADNSQISILSERIKALEEVVKKLGKS